MASPIIFKRVTYKYPSDQPDIQGGISDVSFQIKAGSFAMIVGQTGSGKSTLVQQINGLLRPTRGLVQVGSIRVTSKMNTRNLIKLRKQVGLVFQVAQDQLFGETVEDDLAFGPRNFDFDKSDVQKAVKTSANALNLSKLMLSKSSFDLSGGQMKRVAIAGVIACFPKILILDEPTVGLDSFEEHRIMTLLCKLKKQFHLTIIMVTHQMDLVAKYATQVLVLNHGQLVANVTPDKLFKNVELLHKSGLKLPFAPRFANELSQLGIKLNDLPLDLHQLSRLIVNTLKMRRYRE